MRIVRFALVAAFAGVLSARGDLTIVQTIEGAASPKTDRTAPSEMTIKIKGDKARIDSAPQFSMIIDSKSGDVVNLLFDQKKFMRVSGKETRAIAETAARFRSDAATAEKPKLVATGKRETINGYDAEEYASETPDLKARYWIAPKYPDGAAILKQLQSITPQSWGLGNSTVPDYRDFPGVPVRTEIKMGSKDIVTTVKSVSTLPLPDTDFVAPAGFEEMKMPDLGKILGSKPDATAKPARP